MDLLLFSYISPSPPAIISTSGKSEEITSDLKTHVPVVKFKVSTRSSSNLQHWDLVTFLHVIQFLEQLHLEGVSHGIVVVGEVGAEDGEDLAMELVDHHVDNQHEDAEAHPVKPEQQQQAQFEIHFAMWFFDLL